jgi:hypothetical protein
LPAKPGLVHGGYPISKGTKLCCSLCEASPPPRAGVRFAGLRAR